MATATHKASDRSRLAHAVYAAVNGARRNDENEPKPKFMATYEPLAIELGALVRRHGTEQTAAFLDDKAEKYPPIRVLLEQWIGAAEIAGAAPASVAERRERHRRAMLVAEYFKRACEAYEASDAPLDPGEPAQPLAVGVRLLPTAAQHRATNLNNPCDNAGIRFDYGMSNFGEPSAKQKLIAQIVSETKAPPMIYQAAYERQRRVLKDNFRATIESDLFLPQRMFIGGGDASVLETSLTFNGYGMPMIPGSACKGVALAYARAVVAEQMEKDETKGERLALQQRKLFGRVFDDRRSADDEAGALVFYDAWWVPANAASPFAEEVVTVHHNDYYKSSGKTDATDFDDPIPNSMLAARGKFCFAVGCHPYATDIAPDARAAAANLGMQLLKRALTEWGIGGKQSSGYGRFAAPPPAATVRGGAD